MAAMRKVLAHHSPVDFLVSEDNISLMNISVTQSAARRIKEIVLADPAKTALRVAVNGGGCSGFQYAFSIESQRNDDDIAIEKDGATVLIDAVSLAYMDGSEIDFVDDLIGQAFKVNNPLARASCGCGTSFTI
jgi:iron-sulfur cluster assembly accessory protein